MIKIGDFASLFNVSIKTIRFYEEKGLITPAYVDIYSSYRYYDENNIKEMSKIIYLKNLGLSINEIKNFNDELINNKIIEYNNKIQLLYNNIDALKLLSNIKKGEYNMKTFINDEDAIGKWHIKNVYSNLDDYKNNIVLNNHDYIINDLYLMNGGKKYWIISWTKGIIYICDNACPYEIVDNNMILKVYSPIDKNDYIVVVYEKIDNKNYDINDFIINDDINIKFISDKSTIGLWKSIGTISNKDNIDNIKLNSELYLQKLSFYPDNTVIISYNDGNAKSSKYTKNKVLNLCCNNTLCNYEIINKDNKIYMVIEWKSGDYVFGNIVNCYYILEKIQ